LKEYREALVKHEQDTAHYEAEYAKWKSTKGAERGDPPEKPETPVGVRHIVTDITVEALAPLLMGNPRGVLLGRDELAGWLGSFDRYSQKQAGGDSAQWLEVHRAGQILIDRKTGPQKLIFVPLAGVSIAGTIQPEVASRSLGKEHFKNGLAARLLMANPPSMKKRWREDDTRDEWNSRVRTILESLLSLEHTADEDGELIPIDIPLDAEAKKVWIEFYNDHATTQEMASSDDLAAAFSKLEGYAARFGLIFHLVKWAAGTESDAGHIDAQSIMAGIKLAKWFVHETERVYEILAESSEDTLTRELVTFIRSKGGRVSVRDVQRNGPRELRKSSECATDALESLVAQGLGKWVYRPPGAKGGAPSRIFHLFECRGDNDKTKA